MTMRPVIGLGIKKLIPLKSVNYLKEIDQMIEPMTKIKFLRIKLKIRMKKNTDI